jgi:hypothetical protein
MYYVEKLQASKGYISAVQWLFLMALCGGIWHGRLVTPATGHVTIQNWKCVLHFKALNILASCNCISINLGLCDVTRAFMFRRNAIGH